MEFVMGGVEMKQLRFKGLEKQEIELSSKDDKHMFLAFNEKGELDYLRITVIKKQNIINNEDEKLRRILERFRNEFLVHERGYKFVSRATEIILDECEEDE